MRYALNMPIWGDESFVAINFVMRGFARMWDPLVYGQICPLLYMWAVEAVSRVVAMAAEAAGVTNVGPVAFSGLSLRLVAILAGLGGFWLFCRFTRKTLPRSGWLCAVGFFAASYYVTRHTSEVKPYALDLFVSMALTVTGWAVYREPKRAGRWIALILLAPVAVWSSYPAMFVGGGVGVLLTWGLWRSNARRTWFLGWAVYGLVLCAASAWMYVSFAKPHSESASRLFEIELWTDAFVPLPHDGESPVRMLWEIPWWLIRTHTGPMFAYPQGGSPPGSIGTLLLFLIGCARMWKRDRALLLLLLSPFALNLVAAAMQAYPYGGAERIVQHLVPAICILAGLGLSVVLRRLLPNPHRQRSWVIAACALALIPIGSLARSIAEPYKSELVVNRYAAVDFAVGLTEPGDRWVIFNSMEAPEDVPYAPSLREWRGVGAEYVFGVVRAAPVPCTWSPPPDSIRLPDNGRVILQALVASRRGKVVFPLELLDDYVETVAARLGPPQLETFEIANNRKEQESLRVYLFGEKREPADTE